MGGRKSTSPRNLEVIDENLRSAYKGMLEEALPAKFEDLIDQLRRGEFNESDQADGEADP